MEKIFDLEKFANGALTEQINTEGQKVLNNIADPNTDATKVRKITLTISFKPNKKRDVAQVNLQTKTSLVPAAAYETNIMIDKDIDTGKVMATEIKNQIPGQVEMNIDDKTSDNTNVIDLKKANSK